MENKKENTSKLDKIPETMLITLWAKAEETKRKNGILTDENALTIIEKINYDFQKFKGAKMSQVGICTRAKLIDNEVDTFIKHHKDAVIIQLGAGLDARYERLKKPNVTHWYDLDLSEVIQIRELLIPSEEKNTMLSMSLFDYKWIEIVQKHQKPVLIIIEGVLMYFSEEEIKAFFEEICQKFDKVTIVFDMLFYKGIGQEKKHDTLKKTSGKAAFKWAMKNTRDMESWNPKIHLSKEYYMSDYYPTNRLFFWRILYKIKWIYKNLNQRVVKLTIF